MSTLLESLLSHEERADATAADLAWRRSRMAPTVQMWRLSSIGESPRRGHYAELWRYGRAAEGEPNIVHVTRWYESAAARDAAIAGFLP